MALPRRSEREAIAVRKFGPKSHGHPSIGTKCPACQQVFEAGDYTALVCLGPGDDPEEQAKAKSGRPYNAVAVEVHWECAGGTSENSDATEV
jgi:hypothetical protein